MIDPVELDRSSDDEEKKVQSTSNDPVESLVKETQVYEQENTEEAVSQTTTGTQEEYHSDFLEDDSEEDAPKKQELERNTNMNDAVDANDYDVKKRLDKANKELAENQSDSDDSRRRTRVIFKKKLVDLEVSPPSSSSSSDDENEAATNEVADEMNGLKLDPSDDQVNISGQFLQRNEKVLVEIGGRFHIVEAGELEKNLSLMESREFEDERKVGLPPIRQRAKSAPARSRDLNSANRKDEEVSLFAKAKATPTFSYPESTKKVIKKQLAMKEKKRTEEEKRKKEEERMARDEADEAWKCWVERKNREISSRKRQEENDKRRQERANRKDPDEIDEAYQSWVKQKMTQIKRDRIMTQQQQIEFDEGWYLRERRDCNRAFRIWLRNKNEVARRVHQNETKLRKQSVREMRRARKAKKLMDKIREAQQMKYVDYYGYRV